MSAPKEIVLPRAPWEGGGRTMMVAALVGAIGVVAWLASMGFSTHERAIYALAVGLLLLADAGGRLSRLAVRVPRAPRRAG